MDKNISNKLTHTFSDDIDFVMTMDGSCGLYNHSIGDIYHSSYGALTEAKEKFVKPLNFHKNFSQKNEIRVLDICTGIGYNTKAFLNHFFNTKQAQQTKVHIDALEIDKKLVLISPFIKDGIMDCSCAYFLLSNLREEILSDVELVNSVIADSKNSPFLTRAVVDFFKKYKIGRCKYTPLERYQAFLHNIYSQFNMNRNKKYVRFMNSIKLKNRRRSYISKSLYY